MKNMLNSMTNYLERVPERIRTKQIWVWLFFIAITVFVSFGIQKTQFDMTMEGWFADDDPVKLALDDFHAEFGSDDGVFIVYQPKDGNVFSAKSLKVVQKIREDLLNYRLRLKEGETSALSHIVRVNTLVNASVLINQDDALLSRQLVGKHIPTSQDDLDKIRKTAHLQKTFPLLYFSKDEKYGGIFIETDFGTIPANEDLSATAENRDEDEFSDEEEEFSDEEDISFEVDESAVVERVRFKKTDMADYLKLMEDINKVIKQPELADHLAYYSVGNAPMMEYGMEIMEEMGPMFIAMIAIMVILLLVLFRSLSAVVWPISIVVLSTVWVVGIAGWLGITITTMLMLTIMLILAVGTADAVHILSGYLYARNEGQHHADAMRFTYNKSALACLLTTVTTMMGMLALTATPIVHIKVFGFMSAAGVALALFFTTFLLPAMMDLWSPFYQADDGGEKKQKAPLKVIRILKGIVSPVRATVSFMGKFVPNFSLILQKVLDKILPIVQLSPVAFVGFFLTVFGICIYGATQVLVDSNIIEQFKEGTTIRKIYEVVDANMMGTQNMEILVDMGKENAFHDPDLLKSIDRLQETMAHKYPLVVRTSSLVDVVKDSYQTLNEGRKEMYVIPAERRMLSQTLFLFNNANPEDRRKLVSDDYRKSHITVQLYNAGSFEYLNVFAEMHKDINEALDPHIQTYPEMKISITGGLALLMELSDYITWSQIKSLGLAIVVISIILIFVFGSFRAGLISIIPNLIPATLTFGLLGLLGLPLDSDTMIIAPVIIGVAVDDTIHFITHYRGEVLTDGDITRALNDTIKEVGQAIIFTSLILGLGFSVMANSNHMGMSNMGKFGTLAIFAALLCDLFLLPSMILIFKPKFQKKGARSFMQNEVEIH